MNKLKYCSIVVILFMLIVVVFFIEKKKSEIKQFECHANLRFEANYMGDSIYANLFVNLFPRNGYSTISGGVRTKDKVYVIHRDVYFTGITSENVEEITIKKEVILPGDDMDEKLWDKLFAPRPVGVPFYIQIKNIKDNLYYVTLPSSPLYTCVASSIK